MEGNRYKKGLWSLEEDKILMDYISVHGKGRWNRIAKVTGLKRCGKSCRLRWMNYLSPNIKRGDFTEDEEDLIIRLHKLLGNRWSLIAGRVPGRTDNQVKNHWNTHLSKKLRLKKGASNVTDPSSLARASPGDGKGKGEAGPEACQEDGVAAQFPSCGSSEVLSGTQGEDCRQQQGKIELPLDHELELTTSTNYSSSFWVANVDDWSLDTCGLMELFDQYDYCIDMGWHHF